MTTPLFITYDLLSRAYEDCRLHKISPHRVALPNGDSVWHPYFEGTG